MEQLQEIGRTNGQIVYMDMLSGGIVTKPEATISAYEPSVADRWRWGTADFLRDRLGFSTGGARDVSERIFGKPFTAPETDALTGLLDSMGIAGVTGLSAIPEIVQAKESAASGRYGDAAMNLGGAALDGAPFIGGAWRFLRRGAAPAASEAAAALATMRPNVYGIGDRLAAARSGSYVPQPGKPGTVSIPDLGQFDAMPIGPIEEAAREYMLKRGVADFGPVGSYPAFDEGRAAMIARAYDMMKHDPGDPLVKRAYDAMIQETLDQYNALRGTGIDFRFLKDGMSDPYARSPALGYQDMVENGRLWVFPTDFGFGSSSSFDPATNPLLTRVGRIGDKPDAVANDAFRAVHDAFGHFGPGNPFFRHQGEERAWLEHSRMYSPEARGAMTSETRGQNSWLNFGPYGQQNRTALGADTHFADQKTGLMPQWTWGLLGPQDEQAAIREWLSQTGQR